MSFKQHGNGEGAEAVGERAVSPVIGVILMVAITVILAAVIGVFVLGLGDAVQDTPPNVQIDADWDGDNVTLTHASGETMDASALRLVGPGDSINFSDDADWQGNWPDEISAGDSATTEASNVSADNSGDTIRIIWESGGSSSTIKTFERP